jgi:hypothetical protein
MHYKYLLLWLPLLLPPSGQAQETRRCAASIGELKLMLGDQTFPLRWEESTMRDGKPLMVSILEENNSLLLQFIKDKEGLWAESRGVICQAGSELGIEFTREQIRFGPAANWVLKVAMGNGGKFVLNRVDAGQLQITTSGWQGVFVQRTR